MSVSLSQAETNEAFRSLAARLGYEVPRGGTKLAPLLFLHDEKYVILSCASHARRVGSRQGTVLGFRAMIHKKRAFVVLKRLAAVLGWELTEE